MFFKKVKEKKEDLKEIKEAMAEEKASYKSVMQNRRPIINEMPPIEMSVRPSYSNIEKEIDGAPLFVKVDKYKALIASVQELKNFVDGLKQLFNVMYDLETVRSDTLKILKATTVKLEKTLTEIDTDLLRPKGLEMPEIAEEADVAHLEESLSDLQRQLQDLKRDLQELR